jgi:hypothetical protein
VTIFLRFLTGLGTGVAPVVVPPTGFDARLSDLALQAGDAIIVPAGETWLADLTTSPDLGYMQLNGFLTADPSKDNQLKVTGIAVGSSGGYFVGSLASPQAHRHDLIVNGQLVGTDTRTLGQTHIGNTPITPLAPNDGGGATRGILIADGGKWEWFGVTPTTHRSFLADDALVGATSIKVRGVINFRSGDRIVLGQTSLLTDLSGNGNDEELIVSADTVPDLGNGWTVVSLTTPLAYFHAGKVQYATDAGMSFTPGLFTKRASASVPLILDQSAEVMLMTRKATISAPADAQFTGAKRLGVHLMKMGLLGSLIMVGVEIFNCGQGGALTRYPIHWHQPSYHFTTKAFVGALDTTKNYIKNCAIRKSLNRGITLHGCQGAKLQDNNLFDIKGHAIFLEDGSEMNNIIDGQWVCRVRDPGAGYRIKDHDSKAAAFWVTNLANTFINNRGSNAHFGRWSSLAEWVFGTSSGASINGEQIRPAYNAPTLWQDNTFHSCYEAGSFQQETVIDEQGQRDSNSRPRATNNGQPDGTDVFQVFTREILWKNNGGQLNGGSGSESRGNYANKINAPLYDGWTVADCIGTDFSGATNTGESKNHLFVGKGLYVETLQNTTTINRNGFASYHDLLFFHHCSFINYHGGNLQSTYHYGVVLGNSASLGWDLYLDPVYMGFARSTANQYIDSYPFWHSPGPNMIRHESLWSGIMSAAQQETWVAQGVGDGDTSGAILDMDGSLGGLGRVGSYLIHNIPFYTTNLSDLATPVELGGVPSYQKVTNKTMIGIRTALFPGVLTEYSGNLTFQRCNPATLADLAGVTKVINPAGSTNFLLNNGAAIASGQAVRIFNSTGPTGQSVRLRIDNCTRAAANDWTPANGWNGGDDHLFIGVPWSGSISKVYGSNVDNYAWDSNWVAEGRGALWASVGGGGKAALLASTGRVYWLDTSTNTLWVRVMTPHTLAFNGTLLPVHQWWMHPIYLGIDH